MTPDYFQNNNISRVMTPIQNHKISSYPMNFHTIFSISLQDINLYDPNYFLEKDKLF